MASHFDDPSQWRLMSNGGTVPIKFLGIEGSFEPETGGVVFRALIPSNRLVDFIEEALPPTLAIGNVRIPQSDPLPGLPGMYVKRVSFKAFDDSRPIDPFGFDPDAPEKTYGEVIEVTLDYGPRETQDPDENDPRTFLEVTGNATGQFFETTAPGAKWQTRTRDTADVDDDEEPGDSNEETLPPVEGAKTEVRDPTVPILMCVPMTEWTVKWNQIPFDYFQNTLIYRIRWCLGRVNSSFFPLLFNAYPETVLLDGYNYQQSYTWRNGNVGTPPINLEMKFVEKRIVWKGVIRGHNDIWHPGVGWERLLIDGVNPSYASRDLNVLFRV